MTRLWKNERIVIRKGWYEAGRQGTAVGEPVFVEQDWLPVLWDDDEDPTFHKLAGMALAPVEPVDDAWAVLHEINIQATRMERATSERSHLIYDLERIALLSKNALDTHRE